jgi:hypothetical protein
VAHHLAELDASPRRLRSFGLTVGGVLVALALWFLFRGRYPAFRAGAGGAGLLLVLAGLAAPGALRPVHRAWMAAAFALGWVTSRVLLTAIFLGVVTPLALLARLVGKRFLDLGFDRGATTYWVRREPGTVADLEKMS